MAHLLHNCSMKVKTQLMVVSELVARVKVATVKNSLGENYFAHWWLSYINSNKMGNLVGCDSLLRQ